MAEVDRVSHAVWGSGDCGRLAGRRVGTCTNPVCGTWLHHRPCSARSAYQAPALIQPCRWLQQHAACQPGDRGRPRARLPSTAAKLPRIMQGCFMRAGFLLIRARAMRPGNFSAEPALMQDTTCFCTNTHDAQTPSCKVHQLHASTAALTARLLPLCMDASVPFCCQVRWLEESSQGAETGGLQGASLSAAACRWPTPLSASFRSGDQWN